MTPTDCGMFSYKSERMGKNAASVFPLAVEEVRSKW